MTSKRLLLPSFFDQAALLLNISDFFAWNMMSLSSGVMDWCSPAKSIASLNRFSDIEG